jgi:WhiB family redox-sensing transcriptional regulator
MSRGLCAETDPESFFPEKGGSVREAKQTCMACEVRTDCLTYALEHGERFGVWGGLTERERRQLAKGGEPRPCAREGCEEFLPATAHGSKRYHTPECAQLARKAAAEGVA